MFQTIAGTRRHSLTCSFISAVMLGMAGAVLPAFAADLTGSFDRYGSAYDDPRYADIYGRPQARPVPPREYYDYGDDKYTARRSYGEPRYTERVPLPPERVYRDDRFSDRYNDRLRDRYADRGHAAREDQKKRHARGGGCPPQQQIQYELERDGWGDFHLPRVVDEETASLRARRPNGRLFHLTVDRCSGEILSARPIEPHRSSGAYAYGSEPRRYRY